MVGPTSVKARAITSGVCPVALCLTIAPAFSSLNLGRDVCAGAPFFTIGAGFPNGCVFWTLLMFFLARPRAGVERLDKCARHEGDWCSRSAPMRKSRPVVLAICSQQALISLTRSRVGTFRLRHPSLADQRSESSKFFLYERYLFTRLLSKILALVKILNALRSSHSNKPSLP